MKPTLYLETSVISYLASTPSRDVIVAGRQALTLEWWNERSKKYKLYVSALVVKEVEAGNLDLAKRRLDFIKNIPALEISQEALALSDILIDTGPIPKNYSEDALHIAVCAVFGIDYLLTWNCKHLANAYLRRLVEKIVDDSDYICPVICTPEELMEA